MMSGGWIGWAALALAVAANVVANLLLKHAMSAPAKGADGGLMQNLPALAAGLVAAGALLGFYLVALRHLPVSVAYPIVTGTAMVGIALLSSALFGETLSMGKMLGILGIVASTVLILRS